MKTVVETNEDLRTVCLELAVVSLGGSPKASIVIKMADEFYNYIKNGKKNENKK